MPQGWGDTDSTRITVSDAQVGTKKRALRSNQENRRRKAGELLDKENPIQGPGVELPRDLNNFGLGDKIGTSLAVITNFKIQPFRVGDLVKKSAGYEYPGIIVSVFTTRAGAVRYVVEADHPAFVGMLHIFNGDQLEPRT